MRWPPRPRRAGRVPAARSASRYGATCNVRSKSSHATARGRSAQSTRWLERQLNDPYVARARADGWRSRAAYKLTELDEKFSGRGLSGILVHDALEDTRAAGKRVVPVCPLVKRYVSKHPEVQDIVDPVTQEILDSLR